MDDPRAVLTEMSRLETEMECAAVTDRGYEEHRHGNSRRDGELCVPE